MQEREDVGAGTSQPVLLPLAAVVAVGDLRHEAGFDQPAEAGRQDVVGDAQVGLEFLEPGHAHGRVPQDQQCPAVAENVGGPPDRAGRRLRRLDGGIGLSGFAVASAVGGAAGNFTTLAAARAAQGAFGALLAPAALSLLTVTFTAPKERARALAVFSAVAGGGAAIGLLLGGVLTQYLSWRYCMYVNVVFAAVAGGGALAVLREPATRTRPRLDAASVITVSAGLFALVYGFSHAETAGWNSPVTLGALAAGVALLAIFAVLQAKVASPLLPLRILADRTRAGAYLAILTVGISIFGMLLFVTYYLQQNLRFSAIEAGLAFLPMTFALAIAAQLSIRRILPKAGPRAAITPGLLLAAAGAFLLLLAAAVITAALLRRPAATAAPTGAVPAATAEAQEARPAATATAREAGPACPARGLETCGTRA
ncbi:MAG TPA: MFS transporter [Trebonia sp.]